MIQEPTILIVVFLAALTLFVPQKYFLIPFIIAACFIPTDQRFVIGQLDFTVLRILVVVGILRMLVYGENVYIRLNELDKMILLWALCGALIYVIQWKDSGALINRSGFLFDVIGLYYLFRMHIQSWEDGKFVFNLLACSAVILLPLVIIEWSTGCNPFVVLGKVITNVRGQRFRCQAAFPHSIMLGLFWSTLVPVFIGLAITEKRNVLYWIAAASSLLIIIASASSTPILVLAATLVCLCGFNYRQYAKSICTGLLLMSIALHVIMNAPVWHLLARINVIGSSTGWHRYNLINQAVQHFNEWMVIGCRNTESWGFGLGDVTNQFVLEGVRGGSITLFFFIMIIYKSSKTLLRLTLLDIERKESFLIWCFYSAIAGHCIAFLGVSYFGQIKMLWYIMLAMVSLLLEYKHSLENSTYQNLPVDISYAAL